MHPEEITLGQLLNTRYPLIIPKYQRAYAWEKEQVEDFINDLKSVYSFNNTSPAILRKHFFGGIVSITIERPGTTSGREFDIVDGQQRLATFVLTLSSVLRGLIELAEDPSAIEKEKNAIQANIGLIKNTFISYDEIENGTQVVKPRLLMSQVDKDYFQDLVNDSRGVRMQATRASHNRLLSAYLLIYKTLVEPITLNANLAISEKMQSLLEIKKTINDHSYFIHIFSGEKAEAYKLFSVLNDRGVSLSDGDLLRSKTLEQLEGFNNQQERVVDYWDNILSGNVNEIDRYLKCHYTSFKGERAPQRDMFDKFSDYFFNFPIPLQQAQANDLENKISNLWLEQGGYKDILVGDWPYTNPEPNSKVTVWDRNRLQILSLLFRHSLCYPLLESAWKCLPEKVFSEIIQIIEIFAFRYIIVSGSHPGGAESIYYDNAKNIRLNSQNFDLQSFRRDLQSLINTNAPDSLFEEQLTLLLDYSKSSNRKFIKYFLTTIESYWSSYHQPRRRRNRPITPHKMLTINFDQTTIEHIYPQTGRQGLTEASLESFKHTIGNLSIWAPNDNNAAGNLPFSQKQLMYQSSSLALNRHLGGLNNWNITELENRKLLLLNIAKKIYAL